MAIANICMDKGEWKTALEYYLAAYNMDNTLEFIDLFLAISFYKNENMSASKIYLHKAMAQNLDAIIHIVFVPMLYLLNNRQTVGFYWCLSTNFEG